MFDNRGFERFEMRYYQLGFGSCSSWEWNVIEELVFGTMQSPHWQEFWESEVADDLTKFQSFECEAVSWYELEVSKTFWDELSQYIYVTHLKVLNFRGSFKLVFRKFDLEFSSCRNVIGKVMTCGTTYRIPKVVSVVSIRNFSYFKFSYHLQSGDVVLVPTSVKSWCIDLLCAYGAFKRSCWAYLPRISKPRCSRPSRDVSQSNLWPIWVPCGRTIWWKTLCAPASTAFFIAPLQIPRKKVISNLSAV